MSVLKMELRSDPSYGSVLCGSEAPAVGHCVSRPFGVRVGRCGRWFRGPSCWSLRVPSFRCSCRSVWSVVQRPQLLVIACPVLSVFVSVGVVGGSEAPAVGHCVSRPFGVRVGRWILARGPSCWSWRCSFRSAVRWGNQVFGWESWGTKRQRVILVALRDSRVGVEIEPPCRVRPLVDQNQND
jgi:hypothetical protein